MPGNRRTYNSNWTAGCFGWGQWGPKTWVQKSMYKCKERWVIQTSLYKLEWTQKCLKLRSFSVSWATLNLLAFDTGVHPTSQHMLKEKRLLSLSLYHIDKCLEDITSGFVFLLHEKGFEPATFFEPASQNCAPEWVSHWSIHPAPLVTNKN